MCVYKAYMPIDHEKISRFAEIPLLIFFRVDENILLVDYQVKSAIYHCQGGRGGGGAFVL